MASTNRFKFTETSVAKLCVPPAPGELSPTGKPLLEKRYWDTELRGFGVVVRADSASFIVLRDVFAECLRVLEPGGRLCVNVANLGRKPYR